MALSIDQISAITKQKYIPKMYDNIFDSNPLLQRLKKKSYQKLDGGTSIRVPLNYATISASGWYAGADTLNTSMNEVITAAEYSWKQLYVNIALTRLDELKNSGDSQVLSILKSHMKVAEKTMQDKLGTGLYSSGSDANSIVGLGSIVSTTASSGGISASAYSWWQGNVDSTTTTLSISAMQSLYQDCTVNNDAPTIISTTRSIYNLYYGLLQPQQRFQDAESAKGGFTSIMFNSTPVLADSYCTASAMFMLNEEYLHLFAHKEEDMRLEPFQKPINQNVKVGKIYWMGALGSSNNRLHGKLSAITA